VTSGVGESELTIHAGSFHFALLEAGIHAANIMIYSSILPATAREVPHKSVEIRHGEVMEMILAQQSVQYGQTATAGLSWAMLEESDGSCRGGLVCEYSGSMPADQADRHLREMLAELHDGSFAECTLKDVQVLVRTVTPMKMYGTALVGLCFVNYDLEEVPDGL
jgi:arginine decarboxylase